MTGMNSRVALPVLALLVCGVGVAGVLWIARGQGDPPPTATLSDSLPPATSAQEAGAREPLVPPPAWSEPAPDPEPEPAAGDPAPEPAAPKTILEETEADWQARYEDADAVQLRRDLALLQKQFRDKANAEYERRFDSGQYELVEGATEPRNDPWIPGAFLQLERPGGEAADEVHRVVLYQYEVPELYAMQAKLYWLQQRLDALAPPGGGGQ